MKIGVFGGCFNPPHIMHYRICSELLKEGVVDKIIIVPTGNAYNKSGLTDIKHRIKMLELLFGKRDDIEISNYEDLDYQIYTYQTLNHFKDVYPNDEILFICGADNLKDIKTWKNFDSELVKFKIIVVGRNSEDVPLIASELRNSGLNVVCVSVKSSSASSTLIREFIKKEEKNKIILNYLSKNVLQYVKDNQLYVE